jgi:glucose 1-dehydrogenase
VAKVSDIQATIEHIVKTHGAIDILVNNAAISIAKDFLEITEEDFDRVIDINLKGSFLLTPRGRATSF